MRRQRQNRFQNKDETARLQAEYCKGRRFSFGIDFCRFNGQSDWLLDSQSQSLLMMRHLATTGIYHGKLQMRKVRQHAIRAQASKHLRR